MPQQSADRHHMRRQHDEMLFEMRNNMRTERQLIEQSHVRIMRSRELLDRTDSLVHPPAEAPASDHKDRS
jgi:hypothetical protein